MNAVAMGRLDVCAARVSAQVELGDGKRMYNSWRMTGPDQM
jgi:hypothetical protein